jgi:hypothetical protein
MRAFYFHPVRTNRGTDLKAPELLALELLEARPGTSE